MAMDPIKVELSKFEHLEILRQEVEQREAELKETEKSVRAILWENERLKYLQSLHPTFAQLVAPNAGAGQLKQLQELREVLGAALVAAQDALKILEVEMKGQRPPASPPRKQLSAVPLPPKAPGASLGAAPRNRFDVGDPFRAQRPGGEPKT